MAELANWVIQWGPNPWGPNSCRSIQQADLEFARLKEMAKLKLFSRKSLKCAGAWAVWLAAKSQAEEKEAAQAEIQRLKEENGKLKAEIKAQRLKLEEGKTRESIAAVEQVRSVLQYQEVCEQKKAVLSENKALKDKLAVSTRTVEEFQGAIRALVQKIQALKEKGADHRACEARVEKLKAALGAKHSAALIIGHIYFKNRTAFHPRSLHEFIVQLRKDNDKKSHPVEQVVFSSSPSVGEKQAWHRAPRAPSSCTCEDAS